MMKKVFVISWLLLFTFIPSMLWADGTEPTVQTITIHLAQ